MGLEMDISIAIPLIIAIIVGVAFWLDKKKEKNKSA